MSSLQLTKISNKITPVTFKGEIILIPVQTLDTRVECINPKYIKNVDHYTVICIYI